jgi:DNA-binding transcriptional MerR regulator
VLRYWEQEFVQLRPVKRRGNRRYYQHQEVLLIRRIRELLYDQGFTINGARNQLGRKKYEIQSANGDAPRIKAHVAVDLTKLTGEIKNVISLLRS